MTSAASLSPDFDIRPLACAVLIAAYHDLRSERLEKSLDAALFLAGPEAETWFIGAGMSDLDPLAWLVTSGARKAAGKRKSKARPEKRRTNERNQTI